LRYLEKRREEKRRIKKYPLYPPRGKTLDFILSKSFFHQNSTPTLSMKPGPYGVVTGVKSKSH
jgi:hypothetical protein